MFTTEELDYFAIAVHLVMCVSWKSWHNLENKHAIQFIECSI